MKKLEKLVKELVKESNEEKQGFIPCGNLGGALFNFLMNVLIQPKNAYGEGYYIYDIAKNIALIFVKHFTKNIKELLQTFLQIISRNLSRISVQSFLLYFY